MLHSFTRLRGWAAAAVYGLLLIASTVLSTGCTAVGLGIGSAIDSRRPSWTEVPRSEWNRLKSGQEVRVARTYTTQTEQLWIVGVAQATSDSGLTTATDTASANQVTVLLERSIGDPYDWNQFRTRGVVTADTLRLHADLIAAIHRPPARRAKLYGTLAGLAIDVTLFVKYLLPSMSIFEIM